MRIPLTVSLLLLHSYPVFALHNGNFTSIYDAIPELWGISLTPPPYPELGTRNLTKCCLLALKTAFDVQNGSLVIVDPSFLFPQTTAESFLDAIDNGQFPCGAAYDGNAAGAPLVKASYIWSKVNCPGWMKSDANKPEQWLAPLVQFLLPSLVFSTSIPRRRKLEVSDVLFSTTPGKLKLALAPIRFLLATIIVTVDILIWLALCFAFAGPMILSGVFEVYLDSRILAFVKTQSKKKLDKIMSTRLLYIILVGNLDFKWNGNIEGQNEADPWKDLQQILEEPSAATKLPAMLDVQNSFGTTVGVPVTFFAGGFLYSLFDIKSALGTNYTAHALAFGMWWIIIPHMAIVSSLLLAGNNPFIFQTAVGAPAIKHRPIFGVLAQAYKSRYKTEWLWFRGRSKYLWLQRTFRLENSTSKRQLTELESSIHFTLWDWLGMIAITTTLVFVPCVLSYLISFYTPQIGLSCRSMTFLTYFSAQVGQIAIWVWVLYDCTIDDNGKTHSPAHHSRRSLSNHLQFLVYWTLAIVFIGTSIFTSIGGTIMQLLGVYNNSLCALPIQVWSRRNSEDLDAYISLGLNSAEDIASANVWWFGLGTTATAFLCAATYYGWWYQRHLRALFREVAENI